MNDDNMRDLFVWGPAITVVLALCILFACLGCSSTCPPPRTEVVKVEIPVYSCPPPQDVPELSLPMFPGLPDQPTDDQMKSYYAEMVVVVKLRYQLLLNRIRVLEEMLDKYRSIHE
jgi:hypothetical protein